jgi:hypothetical protein
VVLVYSVYFSPWVAYEVGGAYLRSRIDPSESRLWIVYAHGFSIQNVPSPFNTEQALNLGESLAAVAEESAGCADAAILAHCRGPGCM